jgi:hypothetical protein
MMLKRTELHLCPSGMIRLCRTIPSCVAPIRKMAARECAFNPSSKQRVRCNLAEILGMSKHSSVRALAGNGRPGLPVRSLATHQVLSIGFNTRRTFRKHGHRVLCLKHLKLIRLLTQTRVSRRMLRGLISKICANSLEQVVHTLMLLEQISTNHKACRMDIHDAGDILNLVKCRTFKSALKCTDVSPAARSVEVFLRTMRFSPKRLER